MESGGRVGPPPGEDPGRWRNRFARFVAFSTFLLIFAGGMVTSTGSGLAVPDWPLAFGEVLPEQYIDGMSPSTVGNNRGVFYEHTHRLIASAVGFLVILLAVWLWRAEPRGWVRRLGWIALGAVILQGGLGGLTVVMKLPVAVSTAHAGVANLFLLMTVALAVVTGSWWRGIDASSAVPSRLPGLAVATTAVIYLQILVGALMRHTGSGLAIPDFPLAFGRLLPPLDDYHVVIHFLHRLGAVATTVLVGMVVYRALRDHRQERDLVLPALLLAALTATQVTLGAYVIWTAKAVNLTTLHVTCGSATLAAGFLLALRAGRKARRTAPRSAAPDLLSAEGRA